MIQTTGARAVRITSPVSRMISEIQCRFLDRSYTVEPPAAHIATCGRIVISFRVNLLLQIKQVMSNSTKVSLFHHFKFAKLYEPSKYFILLFSMTTSQVTRVIILKPKW